LIVGHHGAQSKKLIADQPIGGNGIQGGVVFRVPKDGLLRAPAMMEAHQAFGRFAFVGNNDPVVEIKIPRLKQIQLDRTLAQPLGFPIGFPMGEDEPKATFFPRLGFHWVSKYDHWESILFQRLRFSTMALRAEKHSKDTEALNCTLGGYNRSRPPR
jgi:hypothetical protein